MELQVEDKRGFAAMVEELQKEEDTKQLFKLFKDIVLMAYCKKSPDGKRPIKTPELRAEFASSEAFSELVFDIMGDEAQAAAFITGILPAGISVETPTPEVVAPSGPPEIKRVLTRTELISMPDHELREGLASGKFVMADDDQMNDDYGERDGSIA